MGYAYEAEGAVGKAYGHDLNISPKHAAEVCAAIRGMMVPKAFAYLERAARLDPAAYIPFRRHRKKVPHRKGGVPGRWPVKAIRHVQKVLQNAVANAENRGLSRERLKIVHAVGYKGVTLKRTKPKGRARPHNMDLTNIEIVVKQV